MARAVLRTDGDRKEENKDKKTEERDRRGPLEKAEGRRREGKEPTPGGNRTRSKSVRSAEREESTGGLPFFLSVNENYFYPHKG